MKNNKKLKNGEKKIKKDLKKVKIGKIKAKDKWGKLQKIFPWRKTKLL